jgi:hypothetical protein
MNFRCRDARAGCCAFSLIALILSGTASFGQNVAGFLLGKIQNFHQSSSAAPVIDPAAPFQFGSIISMGTANIASAMATFTGTASPRAYAPVGNGDFSILDTFTTQSQLDSAYGGGNYTLSINTDAGTFSRTIFLFPFSYPTTPMLTVPANNWQAGVLSINAAADYNLTWNSFSNANPIDQIELIVGTSTFGPFPATQTSFTLAAGTLQPATSYSCALAFLRVAGTSAGDSNIGPGYALLAKSTNFTIQTQTPALALTSAVSRKFHGAVGAFDVGLPLSGSPGIECRSGGANGNHTLVIAFTNAVVGGDAAVSAGTGNVAGPPTFSGNTMTVDLTGVANAQVLTVTLSNVTDQFSQTLPNTNITAAFLVGDTNANGVVNAADVSQTKSQLGQAVTGSNFRTDINANGTINAADGAIVKANTGTSLPP